MAKVLVVYGSTTGNTETLAQAVESGLNSGGAETTVKNVTDTKVEELADYDVLVFGCSTWGEGELQEDFIDFHDEMSNIPLKGKKAAVFGPGDSEGYPDSFCVAVDMIEETAKKCGAEIIVEGLKVDGDVEPAMGDAEAWGAKIAKSL